MKYSGVIYFKSKHGNDDGFIFSIFGMLDGQTDILSVILLLSLCMRGLHVRIRCPPINLNSR